MKQLNLTIITLLLSGTAVFGQQGHGHHHGPITSDPKWEKESNPEKPTLIFYKLPRCGICARIDNWLTPLHSQDKEAANFVLKNSTLPESQPEMKTHGIQHHGIVILDKAGKKLWTANAHSLRHNVLAEAYAKHIPASEPEAEDGAERPEEDNHAHLKLLMGSEVVPEGSVEPYIIIEESNSNIVAAEVEEPDRSQWGVPKAISIPAKSDTEYKFYLVKGATMEYSWKTNKGDLFFDFHGEPTGGKAGYFESFKKGTSDKIEGSFTAPFSGTIGWYWQNSTPRPVVVTLRAKGSYIVMDKKSKQELDELIRQEEILLEEIQQEQVLEEDHGHTH